MIDNTKDDVQQLVMLAIKTTKLSWSQVIKALKLFFVTDKTNDFKEINGKQKLEDLKLKGNTKFTESEIDKKDLKEIQKEFKKYNIDFSLVKEEKGKYTLAFLGKDTATIEKAMKNIVAKKQKELNNPKRFNNKELAEKVKDASLQTKKEVVRNNEITK